MSDANLCQLAKIAESTLGTTPATPELTKIRFTGEDLRNNKETVQSQEIRDDRQVPDLTKVHTQPEGGYSFELDYANFDQEWRGALGAAAWNNVETSADTLAIDATAQTITDSDSGGIFSGVVAGALILIENAEDSGNNGLKRVVSATDDVLTLAAGSLTTDNTDDIAMTISQKAIVNGALKPSMTLEKKLLNASSADFFQTFLGMVVDTFSINVESRQIVTGEVQFIGMTRATSEDTIDNSGAYTEPTAASLVNGTSNIGSITVDGSAASEKFKSLSIEIANNLRGKDAMGVEGNFDIGTGTFTVTGTLSAYFLDNDFLDKIDANTSFALSFAITDAEGNAYHIFLPNCKPANGDPSIEAINTDVMVDIEYQAIRDATYGITMAVNKVDA